MQLVCVHPAKIVSIASSAMWSIMREDTEEYIFIRESYLGRSQKMKKQRKRSSKSSKKNRKVLKIEILMQSRQDKQLLSMRVV